MRYLFVTLSFFTSMCFAMVIIPKLLEMAVKYSLFDKQDDRKIHKGEVPRIGGVSFVPCILFSMMFVMGIFQKFYQNETIDYRVIPNYGELSFFICGLLLLYLGGVKDDLVGLRYFYKFLMQVISSGLLIISGLYINNFHGFLGIHEFPTSLGIPLTVLLMVFIINAINLIDGIDGLASGISIFALCVYGTLYMLNDLWFYVIIAFSSIGVLLTFFYYNVFGSVLKRRKLFMGDSGSLTLGFILGFLAIRYVHYDSNFIKPNGDTLVLAMSPLLIPMLDVMRVALSRAIRRKHLFKGDRSHIHHKLLDLGLRESTALVMLLCMSSGLFAVNYLLMGVLNSSLIFAIDVALWIILNMYISHLLGKRTDKPDDQKLDAEKSNKIVLE